jgi:hypothetical protein
MELEILEKYFLQKSIKKVFILKNLPEVIDGFDFIRTL